MRGCGLLFRIDSGATRLASSSFGTFPFNGNGGALQRLQYFVLGLGVKIYRFVCFRLHSWGLAITIVRVSYLPYIWESACQRGYLLRLRGAVSKPCNFQRSAVVA
jgi:hypothetical protein